MEPPSFSSVFHSVHDFISNYNHFMGSFASAPRGIDAPKGAGRFAPMWSRRITSVHWQGTDPLHIEAEQDNIPILDHIFLALGADQALFPGSGHGAAGHQILIGHHLGPDEAPLKVGVDLNNAAFSTNGNTIKVELDQPYIISNTPDMEKSGVLEENNNIFNPIKVENIDKFQRQCIKQSETEITAGGIFDEARLNAEQSIRDMFDAALGDTYNVEFSWREAEQNNEQSGD